MLKEISPEIHIPGQSYTAPLYRAVGVGAEVLLEGRLSLASYIILALATVSTKNCFLWAGCAAFQVLE